MTLYLISWQGTDVDGNYDAGGSLVRAATEGEAWVLALQDDENYSVRDVTRVIDNGQPGVLASIGMD